MRTTNRNLLALAALGLAGTLTSTAGAQTVINISGATLFENFFKAPASTNDYIDVDGDGFARKFASTDPSHADDQLAPSGAVPPPAQSLGQNGSWWSIQYRETGSVAGFQELITYGGPAFAHGDATAGPITAIVSSKSFYNRTQFINNGVSSNATYFNPANPGGNPLVQDETTLQAVWTAPGVAGVGGYRNDIAPLDVPTQWAVQSGTNASAAFGRTPGVLGYGTNPRRSVNAQGTSTGANFHNDLAILGPRNLFDPSNPSAFDTNTIFSSPIAAVPIMVLTNFGTGYTQMTQSEIRHLFATGRTITGENLVCVTREVGSGTRNGFANALGLDPSWCIGENVGGLDGSGGSVNPNEHLLGPNFVPSNKTGSGDMESTMFNVRLGIGFTGAERAVNNTLVTGGKLEMLGVKADLSGGTTYQRPTLQNLLHNDANGYVISGIETFATLGDPRAAPVALGGDAGNPHPQPPNQQGSAYVNNITRSVEAFDANPGSDMTLFTPGEFLATQYILVAAADKAHDLLTPTTMDVNPALNPGLQTFIAGYAPEVFNNPVYATFGTVTLSGKVPTRQTGFTYSDGVTGSNAYYVTQGGAQLTYGANCPDRNRIAGDFNGDGVRDLNDAVELVKAYYSRHGGPVWAAPTGTGAIAGAPGSDASIELLGDFNGDGNFDMADVRYWADGLAIDPATGKLDRKKGFKAIDDAWQTLTGNNNFFGTTIAGGRPYHNGDSVADVAGAPGIARGWAPVGANGVIDANDVAYIQAQFIGNPLVTDGHANWNNVNEAVGFDLSADVTGDLVVDQADVDAVNAILGGGACYANCDGSTLAPVLNVADFTCFLQRYAAGDAYANCDGSTVAPVLNVADFTCFLQSYAAGCP